MEAKDTVKSHSELTHYCRDKVGRQTFCPYESDRIEAQAEISFKAGQVPVVKAVLAIIESPKQVNYRLKEITEYCEAKLKEWGVDGKA